VHNRQLTERPERQQDYAEHTQNPNQRATTQNVPHPHPLSNFPDDRRFTHAAGGSGANHPIPQRRFR
jgi:hypothetical protein